MTTPFQILKLDHVVLTAKHPEALEAFYRDVLGCVREKHNKGARLIHLRAGTALIDIVPAETAAAAPHKNMEHFCLRVEPFDAESIMAYLDRHGIEHTDLLNHYGADGQGPSIYLHDPEGNRVELKGPGTA
ncbi:MAG: hypothetical protein RLZ98_2174 [Pseudomonadota bacterium]|jgi:glyoxylase I family protein